MAFNKQCANILCFEYAITRLFTKQCGCDLNLIELSLLLNIIFLALTINMNMFHVYQSSQNVIKTEYHFSERKYRPMRVINVT